MQTTIVYYSFFNLIDSGCIMSRVLLYSIVCYVCNILNIYKQCLMGFTYPIPDRWRMCTISYSIPRWRTAISCGRYQDISGPGHHGTEHMRHLGTRYWKFRYWIIKIIWLNLKTFFNFFLHVHVYVVYTNFYVFFFNHL